MQTDPKIFTDHCLLTVFFPAEGINLVAGCIKNAAEGNLELQVPQDYQL